MSSYTETPAVACVVSGFLAGLLALLVSLRDLIEMMSIGTLLAYTLVCFYLYPSGPTLKSGFQVKSLLFFRPKDFLCLQVSLCVLLLRYQPEGDIHGFVNFLSEEQNKGKRKEGVLAECEKDACSPTSEADDYSGPPTNTCGAKNLPSLGDNEMLIGKPDKSAYTASHPNYGTVDMATGIEADESEGGMSRRLKKLIGPRYYTLRIRLGLPGKMDRPTPATGKTVTVCVLLLFIFFFAICSFIIFGENTPTTSSGILWKMQVNVIFVCPGSSSIAQGQWWALLLLVVLLTFIVLLVVIILQQPENPKRLPYMAPCVPFVPASAMLVNIYLMLKLSAITWIRFSIWCFVGKWTLQGTREDSEVEPDGKVRHLSGMRGDARI